jgi:hypothetical protein
MAIPVWDNPQIWLANGAGDDVPWRRIIVLRCFDYQRSFDVRLQSIVYSPDGNCFRTCASVVARRKAIASRKEFYSGCDMTIGSV